MKGSYLSTLGILFLTFFISACSYIKPISYDVAKEDRFYPINLYPKFGDQLVPEDSQIGHKQTSDLAAVAIAFQQSNYFVNVSTNSYKYRYTVVVRYRYKESLFSKIIDFPSFLLSAISLGLIPTYESGDHGIEYIVFDKDKKIGEFKTSDDFFRFEFFFMQKYERGQQRNEYINNSFIQFIQYLKDGNIIQAYGRDKYDVFRGVSY